MNDIAPPRGAYAGDPAYDGLHGYVTAHYTVRGITRDGWQVRRTVTVINLGRAAPVVARLRGVIIENHAALRVLRQYDAPDALHYVDPPYPRSTRGATPGIYEHDMTDDDHRALAAVVHELSGMVIVSGYPCDLYDHELYGGWRRVERQTRAERGAQRTEVLYISPRAADARWAQPQFQLDYQAGLDNV